MICATVLTLAGLWAASSVMTPLAFAVFIIALVWPLQLQGQFFWGMLWGIAGAFIGVPILITLATVCAKYRPSRPIAVLLSADTTTQVKADQ